MLIRIKRQTRFVFMACAAVMAFAAGSLLMVDWGANEGDGLDIAISEVHAEMAIHCPEDYVRVRARPEVGTQHDFCVMRAHARSDSREPRRDRAKLITDLSRRAATNFMHHHAQRACKNLGPGFALISNVEWMTIARDLEMQPENWSSGKVGVGVFVRGHTDDSPRHPLNIENLNDPYDQTGNSAVDKPGEGWEQRRTFVLSSGEVIWDFSGNYWHWVDWYVDGPERARSLQPHLREGDWLHFDEVDLAQAANSKMPPESWSPLHLGREHGLGRYLPGEFAHGGYAMRGGSWLNDSRAGVYSLSLAFAGACAPAGISFRCVYRPHEADSEQP
ncbi:MAG TPA: hypothetical protein PLZ57_15990 [Pseudobdellovibrionaceae bacterium]|nr:hypothetical protein [Pseudobdellovibrionaceae bacterium]